MAVQCMCNLVLVKALSYQLLSRASWWTKSEFQIPPHVKTIASRDQLTILELTYLLQNGGKILRFAQQLPRIGYLHICLIHPFVHIFCKRWQTNSIIKNKNKSKILKCLPFHWNGKSERNSDLRHTPVHKESVFTELVDRNRKRWIFARGNVK